MGEIIDALHLVISEFEDNPIEDGGANDVVIQLMSERLDQHINQSQPR